MDPFSKGVWLFTRIGTAKKAIRWFELDTEEHPTHVEGWYYKAMALSELERYEEAMIAVDKTLALNYYHKMAWDLKISILQITDQRGLLDAFLSDALNSNVNRPKRLTERAESLQYRHELEWALRFFARALDINPEFPDANIGKAVTLRDLGRDEEYRAFIHRFSIEVSETVLKFMQEGQDYYAMGIFDWAGLTFEKAHREYPMWAEPWKWMGRASYSLGYERKAKFSLQRAVRLNPYDHEAWADLGYIISKADTTAWNDEEAIKCFDRAVKIEPKYYQAWSNKGLFLQKHHRYDEAIGCYNEALRIAPNLIDVLFEKARVLISRARLDEALPCLDLILANDRVNYQALEYKGKILARRGRDEEALTIYEQLLLLRDDNIKALAGKALSLSKLDRFEEAMATIKKALRIYRMSPEVLNAKADCYMRQGKLKLALKVINKVGSITTWKYIDGSMTKIEILERMGRRDEACELRRNIKGLSQSNIFILD